ncbi:hypothetical protein PPYR_10985 [Photinus pyralis]|uniref:DUF4604 domain-containing protein n=1 Tax=Photinus pyralis TaxID=7054 RepID=A0A1Y1L8D9_PHOPY|nr:uncharacterized protein KIAA1143 homolog [Photinus pyralis]KAB0796924.1 hypothetical protein PPYR_10985 [Photinus pyralis]
MSKRNITFTKPEEPNFLKRIKEQVGYKEGPTVNTKREALDRATEEDFEDTSEEQPTVVVLRPGDLSAEEATQAAEELKKQAEETPADLNIPVVFKRPSKAKTAQSQKSSKRSSSGEDLDEKTKKRKGKTLLSFDDEEHDD